MSHNEDVASLCYIFIEETRLISIVSNAIKVVVVVVVIVVVVAKKN